MPKPLIHYTTEMMKLLNKAKKKQLNRVSKINRKAKELLEKAQETEQHIGLLDDLS